MALRSWLFALAYDRLTAGAERDGLGALRARLLAEASGRVLEIGAGTGTNLPHYPAAAAVTLTEPEPAMLRRLERRARLERPDATVLAAPAEELPVREAAFDVVVSTLVLCGVADQARALAELRRVLVPGGRLLFLEHVRAEDPVLARRQDRVNGVHRLVARCDCNRATTSAIRAGGFDVVRLERADLPRAPRHVRPLVVGTALALPAAGSTGS